jgi:hypothetical protein
VFGGIYGVKLLALEDSIRAGVVNVPGGPIIEIARLSPVFRPLVTLSLATRVPALLNDLRKSPLHRTDPPPVIIQFAKGDQTVPNPTASAIFRAGDLVDRSTFYRTDLAFGSNAATPKNPHTFLTNVAGTGLAPAIAIAAQTQIGIFFESDGTVVIDPDGTLPFFETPIAGPLPEALNFIPWGMPAPRDASGETRAHRDAPGSRRRWPIDRENSVA